MSNNLKPTVSVEMPDTLTPTVPSKMSDLLENYFAQYSAGTKNKFTRGLLFMSGISTGFTTGQRLHD